MTMTIGVCRALRDRLCDRYFRFFPCLSNPARRSSVSVKVGLVILHLVYVGILFLFDRDLINTTKSHPWAVPERVYPFSEGICRNLYNFCCIQNDIYRLERLPSPQELEEKTRPYTCRRDLLCCRCC